MGEPGLLLPRRGAPPIPSDQDRTSQWAIWGTPSGPVSGARALRLRPSGAPFRACVMGRSSRGERRAGVCFIAVNTAQCVLLTRASQSPVCSVSSLAYPRRTPVSQRMRFQALQRSQAEHESAAAITPTPFAMRRSGVRIPSAPPPAHRADLGLVPGLLRAAPVMSTARSACPRRTPAAKSVAVSRSARVRHHPLSPGCCSGSSGALDTTPPGRRSS